MSGTRRLPLLIVLTFCLLLLIFQAESDFIQYNTRGAPVPDSATSTPLKSIMSTDQHQSPPKPASAQGWHQRATLKPSAGFEPQKSDLVFTALKDAMGMNSGVTMALLRPNLAVDATGRVLELDASDFAAFEGQVRAVSENDTGGKWRVDSTTTCRPFDIIIIPGEEERSVYAWRERDHELELQEVTRGRTTLPKELQVLIGWAKEAREGDEWRGGKDDDVIGKVRKLFQRSF